MDLIHNNEHTLWQWVLKDRRRHLGEVLFRKYALQEQSISSLRYTAPESLPNRHCSGGLSSSASILSISDRIHSRDLPWDGSDKWRTTFAPCGTRRFSMSSLALSILAATVFRVDGTRKSRWMIRYNEASIDTLLYNSQWELQYLGYPRVQLLRRGYNASGPNMSLKFDPLCEQNIIKKGWFCTVETEQTRCVLPNLILGHRHGGMTFVASVGLPVQTQHMIDAWSQSIKFGFKLQYIFLQWTTILWLDWLHVHDPYSLLAFIV